jgi:hypothetical protein
MNYDPEIIRLIKELINNTGSLISLLKSDVVYFKENNLIAIEKNNEEKYLINKKLEEIIHDLFNHPSLMPYTGTLNDKLSQCAQLLSNKERDELEQLLDTMTVVVSTYNQIMRVNRQVVNSNLAFIKDLFFSLVVNNNEEPQSTYGKTGVLEKL